MDLQETITRSVTQYLVTDIGDNYYKTGRNQTEFNIDETMYLQRMMATLVATKIVATVTSVIVCFLAFLSWIMIPKWRTFRNFVYLNLILSYTLTYIFPFVTLLGIFGDAYPLFTCLIWCSYLFWFFTASINTYLDIVKVFSVDISRKKTKCFICVWSATAVNTGIVFLASIAKSINVKYIMYICSIPAYTTLILNCIIYIRVLYSLFSVSSVTRNMNQAQIARKVQVATFTFLVSGSMMIPPFVLTQIMSMINVDMIVFAYYAGCSVITVNIWTILMNFCFVILRSNRVLWRQVLCKGPEISAV